ncbi:hypothetical protein [Salipaludibacillus daqingensis]|uniref:hypothetical protein n=1 Tax=Salipaludibacillus daqingensis TaxID=3041001 RepID=UPI0024743B43|nr:hypothetical protein [Salipaludibacillus daqingensis]
MRKYIGAFGLLSLIIFSGYENNPKADSQFFDDDEFNFEFELNKGDYESTNSYGEDFADNQFRSNSTNGTNRSNSKNHSNSNDQPNNNDQHIYFERERNESTSSQGAGVMDPATGVSQVLEDETSGQLGEEGQAMDDLLSEMIPGLAENELIDLVPGLAEEGVENSLMSESQQPLDNWDMSSEETVLEGFDDQENVNGEVEEFYHAETIEEILQNSSEEGQLPQPFRLPSPILEMLMSHENDRSVDDGTEEAVNDEDFEETLEREYASMPYMLSMDLNDMFIVSTAILESGEGEDPWHGNIEEQGLIDYWTFFELSEDLQAHEETDEIISTLETHYDQYQEAVEALTAQFEGAGVSNMEE